MGGCVFRSISSSHAEKVDKLSPRALTNCRLHKPSSPSSTVAPPLPKLGPGQAHAIKTATTTTTTKPVLVIHKSNVVPASLERRGSANRGGSSRKSK